MISGKDEDIEAALALRARTDEIGLFARAMKASRQGAAERLRLDAARKAAEAASRVKSEFLANMSHELRTPLNAVIGFSELMLHRTFGPLPERYQESAGLINDAGTHLLSLVSDILDLAKIEAGRFALDLSVFDLKAPVEQCLALVRRRAEERRLAITVRLPEGDLAVEADARACKQILLNLLSNAVKFSREGGAITLSVRAPHDCVEIRVRDEGIGIPADVLARIGQPFEQASNNPMLAREGTGLGLALVKALVAEHGGRVTVASQENVGTEITVILPRRQDRAPQGRPRRERSVLGHDLAMVATGVAPGERQRRAQHADGHKQDRTDLINAHHVEPYLKHSSGSACAVAAPAIRRTEVLQP